MINLEPRCTWEFSAISYSSMMKVERYGQCFALSEFYYEIYTLNVFVLYNRYVGDKTDHFPFTITIIEYCGSVDDSNR